MSKTVYGIQQQWVDARSMERIPCVLRTSAILQRSYARNGFSCQHPGRAPDTKVCDTKVCTSVPPLQCPVCLCVCVQAHPVSHLTQQMSQLRPGTNQAGRSPLPPTGTPCCAPTKMAPLPLIYLDSGGGIVFGNLPDMITERCGCA